MDPAFDVDGNRLTLIPEGPDRLRTLLALIDGAQTSLRLVTYIYVDDPAGRQVRDALLAARARGVSVTLVVDGMGSDEAADRGFFDPLADAGARISCFVPRFGRRYLIRNHQKIALADGEGDMPRTLVGGFNIAQDYFGTIAEGAWRDLGLLVEGPAAGRLVRWYDAMAEWTRRDSPPLGDLNAVLRDASARETGGAVRWLLGGPTTRLSPWARAVKQEMEQGSRIDIVSAYFAPSPAMLRRLDRAGLRGEVRLLLPAKMDHGAAIWAARFTYAGLLRKDVRIHEYQPTKLHAKMVAIDDVVHIGSANFDIRSLFLNLELMLRVDDAAFAAHVRAHFERELASSERITQELYRARTPFLRRVKQAAAYFVMAVLDFNLTSRLTLFDRAPK